MIYLLLLLIFITLTVIITVTDFLYYEDVIRIFILLVTLSLIIFVPINLYKGIKVNTDLKIKYQTYQLYYKTLKPLLKGTENVNMLLGKDADLTYTIIKKRKYMLDYNETLTEVQNKRRSLLYYWFTYYGFVPKKILKLKPIK